VVWPRGAACLYLLLHPRRLEAGVRDLTVETLPAVRDSAITEIGRAMAELVRDPVRHDEAAAKLMDALAGHLARYAAPARPPPRIGTRPLSALLDELREGPARPRPIAELARSCGLSRAHFTRRFTAHAGSPPYSLALANRVEKAKHLLAAGSSLAESALECGFADQSHLTRAFVRATGTSPGRYRALHRRECGTIPNPRGSTKLQD
jgi:transcriptional regulator GlxA family with amidase domain